MADTSFQRSSARGNPQSGPSPRRPLPQGLLAEPYRRGAIALLLVAVGIWLRFSTPHHDWTLQINQAAQTIPASVWSALSLLGLGWATVIAVCLTDRSMHAGRDVLICLVLGAALTHGLKVVLAVPRPGLILPESLTIIGTPILQNGSMPSGHTLAAFAMATLWSRQLQNTGLSNRPSLRRSLSIAAWTLAIAIGLSRVAVGAHWISDVVVGAGIGMAIAMLATLLFNRSATAQTGEARPHPQLPWIAGLLETSAAATALTDHEGPAATVWIQWVLASAAVASALARLLHVLRTRKALS